jgi:uncharacterized damage-inducible protein DinB
MSVQSLFLACAADKLREFMGRIEVCTGKLSDDQIWARGQENENAVGNLLLHLNGNLGQWILAGLGSVPEMRDRDGEFAARNGASAVELVAKLRETVERSVQIISAMNEEELTRIREIQNYSVSGVQAVFHVVEHFAQHTGQIIFMTKLLTGEDLGFYRHLQESSSRIVTRPEQAP